MHAADDFNVATRYLCVSPCSQLDWTYVYHERVADAGYRQIGPEAPFDGTRHSDKSKQRLSRVKCDIGERIVTYR